MKPIAIIISHSAEHGDGKCSKSYALSEDDILKLSNPNWRESAKRKILRNLQDQLEQTFDDAISMAIFLRKKELENA